jgi:hypothetical protein
MSVRSRHVPFNYQPFKHQPQTPYNVRRSVAHVKQSPDISESALLQLVQDSVLEADALFGHAFRKQTRKVPVRACSPRSSCIAPSHQLASSPPLPSPSHQLASSPPLPSPSHQLASSPPLPSPSHQLASSPPLPFAASSRRSSRVGLARSRHAVRGQGMLLLRSCCRCCRCDVANDVDASSALAFCSRVQGL